MQNEGKYGWNMRKLETLSAHLSRNCTCQLLLMPLQHAAKDKWDFDSCLTCMDFFDLLCHKTLSNEYQAIVNPYQHHKHVPCILSINM